MALQLFGAAFMFSFIRGLILTLIIFISHSANASSFVILTSYPESFYAPIVQEFSKKYPNIRVRVLNKKTPAVMEHLKQQRSPHADLIWLSSSDAMEQLYQQNYTDIPHTFAWSQLGFFWHYDTIKNNNLTTPKRWEDLLDPKFFNQVALSAPSRSGTNHLLIELILQQYGWDKGWALLNQLGGNIATITARSFGVREGILKQRFSVAPVVDFFYRSAIAQGHNVGFEPIPEAPLIPAQIAQTVKSTNNSDATLFITFLISPEGQALISSPHIGRISVSEGQAINQQNSRFNFDAKLSAQRYHTVNALFDAAVSQRLPQLQHFWQQWGQLNTHTLSPSQNEQLQQAFKTITHPLIEESVASEPTLNQKLSPTLKYEHFYQRVTDAWTDELNQRFDQAQIELDKITSQLRSK